MNITIIHQEKKLPPFYTQALKEYHKRLQRYCKLQLVSSPSFGHLSKKIPSNTYLIGVTIDTSSYSSEAFADFMSQLAISGQSRITFIINPPSDVLARCQTRLSLSALTSNTGLILTTLYEQIYRTYRINLNQAYHK